MKGRRCHDTIHKLMFGGFSMMARWLLATLALCFSLSGALAGDEPYIRPDQLDLTKVLAPAPAPDSATTREDLRILLALQASRTPAQVAQANADVARSLTNFMEVLGVDVTKERAPLTHALVDKAFKDGGVIFYAAKAHWQRIRPYTAFPEVKLIVPPENSFSYPSGHATFGAGTAVILANMVPEKAVALYERGAQFGFERAIAGVHYPSDVEAGRIAGTVIAAFMLDNKQFKEDFKAASTELRGLLGLPPLAAPAPAIPVARQPAAATAK